MKRYFFQFLNKLNKAILPKYGKQDPLKLKKYQQAILAYRYFILIRALADD
ncbi:MULTISPECIES: hypothetical protein [Sphingobacterium]|uniref:SsrA-binding protein n=1 Tax=Sphingobacterium detergens TaxID=1145106 RepID=A0A420BJ83_SPHD1|nr:MULTISPECIES: hypothetical protein [Sphingobacterium]MCS4226759.1 hypothetical protein [Sphingobacterium sp. BIGb0165]RKE56834.1 hypothetical protein DFQ12_1706 [Sphingobacterium detergens]